MEKWHIILKPISVHTNVHTGRAAVIKVKEENAKQRGDIYRREAEGLGKSAAGLKWIFTATFHGL